MVLHCLWELRGHNPIAGYHLPELDIVCPGERSGPALQVPRASIVTSKASPGSAIPGPRDAIPSPGGAIRSPGGSMFGPGGV